MILYFSGGSSPTITKFMQEHKCRRLFSYYTDKKSIESKICDNVFVDCGAWTAFTKNKIIDVNEYINYLEMYKDCFELCAGLDVIPKNNNYKVSAEQSFYNFQTMREHFGNTIQMLPTYHRGEHINNLIRLLNYTDEHGTVDYIGIGGLASNKSAVIRDKFLLNVFDVIHKYRPDIKVHLFGLTDLSILRKYSVYSVDSTTWLIAGANGEIITDFGRIKISDKNFSKSGIKNICSVEHTALRNYVSDYGFELDDLAQNCESRQMFNVLYLKKKIDKISSGSNCRVNKLF